MNGHSFLLINAVFTFSPIFWLRCAGALRSDFMSTALSPPPRALCTGQWFFSSEREQDRDKWERLRRWREVPGVGSQSLANCSLVAVGPILLSHSIVSRYCPSRGPWGQRPLLPPPPEKQHSSAQGYLLVPWSNNTVEERAQIAYLKKKKKIGFHEETTICLKVRDGGPKIFYYTGNSI